MVKKVKMTFTQSVGVSLDNGNGLASTGSMIRIDVYNEKGKYYMVPIYTSDVIKTELPNKAVVAKKNISEWKMMQEENFLFSFYSRDVIYIQQKNNSNMMGYYYGSDISSASIKIKSDDNSEELRKGIQSLVKIEKYDVDILGNLKKVKPAKKRQGFDM